MKRYGNPGMGARPIVLTVRDGRFATSLPSGERDGKLLIPRLSKDKEMVHPTAPDES
jgi:hypothetical protein